ncbi:MAG: hypothetical protein WAM99_05320, partial [Xanthobacteraceae bacterium]
CMYRAARAPQRLFAKGDAIIGERKQSQIDQPSAKTIRVANFAKPSSDWAVIGPIGEGYVATRLSS